MLEQAEEGIQEIENKIENILHFNSNKELT
jgi:hypothetical protein